MEDIISKKEIVLNVSVSGIRQRQYFNVKKEETAFGTVVFLAPKKDLPLNSLMQAAEQTGVPVKSNGQWLFPKGKGLKDFTSVK
ncbi:hypothetical protein KJ780_04250 [Candidatus Micrarchaeota archaeon]|nr:hypothetical protein [Candidatus Micrarchaeota archaeon]